MRALFRSPFLALVALSLVSGVAFAPAENDANSGGDASGSRGSPTLLTGAGPFSGTLHAGGDTDWYNRASVGSPGCAVLTATTGRAATVTVGGAWHTIDAPTAPGVARTLALASVGSLVGGLSWSGSGTDVSDEQFTFNTYAPADLGAGDAGSGQDAGASLATALPIDGLSCVGGSLSASPYDGTDTYTFSAQRAGQIVVTLASSSSEPIALRIFDPNGALLTSSPLAPGGVLDLQLPSVGTYSLTTASSTTLSGTVSYIIGLVGPPGCDPMCRSA